MRSAHTRGDTAAECGRCALRIRMTSTLTAGSPLSRSNTLLRDRAHPRSDDCLLNPHMRLLQDIAELLAPRNLSGWRLNPPEWHRYQDAMRDATFCIAPSGCAPASSYQLSGAYTHIA